MTRFERLALLLKMQRHAPQKNLHSKSNEVKKAPA
jgi:hypothetical protein